MTTNRTTKQTTTKSTTKKTTAASRAGATDGFTAEEREAMKERAKEVRTSRRRSGAAGQEDDLAELLGKISGMPEADRVLAERIHAIVTETAPNLTPRTWYGMPAYAKDGKVLVFFQDAAKFKARYATLGFNDAAALDEGEMWPTSFAVTKLTPAVERRISDLVRRAAG
ncbi:hypothetical protein [Intrasporangium sp. DVR]|uniref:iron chaperone n=1 Tax=Intrasporangium sp. DVR TaxID=3127867 RepID=UPI00313A70F0